ncbi:MAG TPA: hypothetical protein VHG72_00545 [Polyangia bacterium]|nr:hypothetical protein [Polyangia bacterium]
MSFRAIDSAVISEKVVHRVERVLDRQPSDEGPTWRSLCGARVGAVNENGLFEFAVAVALDPESWRLAANCPACLAESEKRELGTLD